MNMNRNVVKIIYTDIREQLGISIFDVNLFFPFSNQIQTIRR